MQPDSDAGDLVLRKPCVPANPRIKSSVSAGAANRLLFICYKILSSLNWNVHVDFGVATFGPALATESPALAEFFGRQVTTFRISDRRKDFRAFNRDSNTISAASAMTTAKTSDVEFLELGVGEDVEIGLAVDRQSTGD